MTNTKEQMLAAVNQMQSIVDRFYGPTLQQELEWLHSALTDGDDQALEHAIEASVDGCSTATSQLRDLNHALDQFESARELIRSEFDAAVDAYLNGD